MLLTLFRVLTKILEVEGIKVTLWKSEIRRTSHNNTEGAAIQSSTSN